MDRRARILVADDDPDLRASLAALLESEGYQVLTATNGRDAVSLVAAEKPDLLVLDLYMPVMNGWEVLDQIDSEHLAVGVPVIVFSAMAAPDASSGPITVLPKGVAADALLRTIAEQLARRSAALEAAAQPPA